MTITTESGLRKALSKQGYYLKKDKVRTTAGFGGNHQGGYQIVNSYNHIEAGEQYDMSFDDVLRFIKEGDYSE